MMEKYEKTFKDANGTSKIEIEGDMAPLNMPKKVNLVNRPKNNGKHLTNIGPKSNGFAGVATLAVIIAVAGIIVAYLTLRY